MPLLVQLSLRLDFLLHVLVAESGFSPTRIYTMELFQLLFDLSHSSTLPQA